MIQAAFEQGLALHQEGRLAAAAERYREVLRQDPAHFDALHLLGIVCVQTGEAEQGVALIERAIAVNGRVAAAHVNLASALAALSRPEAALASYDRALALDPREADVQFHRANLLVGLGRMEAAITGFDAAIALRPAFLEAHNNRGAALAALGRHEAALAGYDRAIELRPDAAEAHNNRSAALNELGRAEEALAGCQTALRLRPEYAEARHNQGNALLQLERPAEALESFGAAIALRQEFADAHNGRGLALYALRRPDEALASYDVAIALRGDHAEARFNRAAARLALGDLPGGFDDYRARWRLPSSRMRLPGLPCPLWEGESLAGRALLVHCEQGFGDSLQFIRYVRPLSKLAQRVTVRADEALIELLRSIPGVEFMTSFDPDAYDFHIPLLDLPRVRGTTLDTIPHETPYLAADPVKVASWAARLAAFGPGMRVGLVWAGKSRRHDPAAYAIDRRRSLSLDRLGPLSAIPGLKLFSLQKGEPATETRRQPAGMELIDLTGDLGDFSDTAALVANLDLVISVDTSVAHLAGALAKPVWVLSRFDGCWRWLNGREDSPWYPTARIFHQRTRGDWDEVIGRVAGELSRLAGA